MSFPAPPLHSQIQSHSNEIFSDSSHDRGLLDLTNVLLIFPELQQKLAQPQAKQFYLFKVLRAHILPLTNMAFNKSGSWYGQHTPSPLLLHPSFLPPSC